MERKKNLLLGKIALQERMLTKEQLYDCLIAQERNPSKSLGQIMISRGYLTQNDLNKLLELQKTAFTQMTNEGVSKGAIFGRFLIEHGLATGFQVNECLRFQGSLAEIGITPIPQLGEIMVQKDYLNKDTLEKALQMQNLSLYSCPDCNATIDLKDLESKGEIETYKCKKCGSEIPFLFAKMAAHLQNAIENISDKHTSDMPDDVKISAVDPKNHFGKYILINRIGKGGTGIVYKAWQKDLNKIVALKVLAHETDTAAGIRTPFGDAEDVKRFYSEIHSAAKLSHPNIVPILDYDLLDSFYFFTMPFITGTTLNTLINGKVNELSFTTTKRGDKETEQIALRETARINEGKGIPIRQALEIVRDIANALNYAHSRGVYHRDVKPQNVIIDNDGKPWIMDFGLAKEIKIGDSAYVKGVIVGTPQYMPPEQAMGDMERVDNRSDIYSLGAVLYEMLTGIPPFDDSSQEKVLDMVVNKKPTPPTRINPDVPKDVEKICLRALKKQKDSRYQKAGEMAEDIDCYLAGKPLPVRKHKKSLLARVFEYINPFK